VTTRPTIAPLAPVLRSLAVMVQAYEDDSRCHLLLVPINTECYAKGADLPLFLETFERSKDAPHLLILNTERQLQDGQGGEVVIRSPVAGKVHLQERDGRLVIMGPKCLDLGDITRIPFHPAAGDPDLPDGSTLSTILRDINYRRDRFTSYPSVAMQVLKDSPRPKRKIFAPTLESFIRTTTEGMGGRKKISKEIAIYLEGGMFSAEDSKRGAVAMFREFLEVEGEEILPEVKRQAESIMSPQGVRVLMGIMHALVQNNNQPIELTTKTLAGMIGRKTDALDSGALQVLKDIAGEIVKWKIVCRTSKRWSRIPIFLDQGEEGIVQDGIDGPTTTIKISLGQEVADLALRRRHLTIAPKTLLTADPQRDRWPNLLAAAISLEANRDYPKVKSVVDSGKTYAISHPQSTWLRMAGLTMDEASARRGRRGLRGPRSASALIRAGFEKCVQRGDIASWEVQEIDEDEPDKDRITVHLAYEQALKISVSRRNRKTEKATKKAPKAG
jgi:hypothetical protein